jgi:uncharacterized protein YkwD
MNNPSSRPNRLVCLALTLALFGCIRPLRTHQCVQNPAQQLVVEINEARAHADVPPVWPSLLLARAAQGHAEALAAGEASGHFGKDGSDPLTRISVEGYHPFFFGENTATGSSNPLLIVKAWLRSPAHREVILDPSVDEVGIGGVPDSDAPVWVADFGSNREAATTRCHPWPVEPGRNRSR